MTPAEQELYGDGFDRFAAMLNAAQAEGTPSVVAAARMIQLAEQEQAPIRAPVGPDAERLLAMVARSSDEELDETRRSLLAEDPTRNAA